jgi:hypothetical protein
MVKWAIDVLKLCKTTTMSQTRMEKRGTRRPYLCGRTLDDELSPAERGGRV